MLRAIGLPLMCLAMFSIAGGHWAVLQTVAWTQMLVEFSKTASLAESVEKTFDGKHPCEMCIKVEQGRAKEEKAPATVKVEKKAEVFLTAVFPKPASPCFKNFQYPALADSLFEIRRESPPQPVPRLLSTIA